MKGHITSNQFRRAGAMCTQHSGATARGIELLKEFTRSMWRWSQEAPRALTLQLHLCQGSGVPVTLHPFHPTDE